MKGLAFHISASTAVGVLTALIVLMFVQNHGARALPGKAWVYPGVVVSSGLYCAPWYSFSGWDPCWHDDELGSYSAIDYNWGAYPYSDAGLTARFAISNSYQNVKFWSLSGTQCTGTRAVFYTDSTRAVSGGDMHYLHVAMYGGVIGSTAIYQIDPYLLYWYRDLGVIDDEQPDGCGWTAPHLHQSGDNSSSSSIWTNKYGDPLDWSHEICWSSCP